MLSLEQRHLILFTKDGYGYGIYADNPLNRIRPIAARHYDLQLDQTKDIQVMSMVLSVYEQLHKNNVITRPYHVILQAFVIDLSNKPEISAKELLLNRMLNEIRFTKRDDYDNYFTLPEPDSTIHHDIQELTETEASYNA